MGLILIQTKVLQRFPMSSLNSTNIYQICLVTYLINILFTQLIFFFFSKLQHVLMQVFKKRIFKCRCLREKNESSESETELQG